MVREVEEVKEMEVEPHSTAGGRKGKERKGREKERERRCDMEYQKKNK